MKTLITLLCLLITSSLFAKVDKKTFEELGDKVIALYDDEAQAEGLTIFNVADWGDKERGNIMIFIRNYPFLELRYPGALAKAQATTVDSLALILCHEMGHVFGQKVDGEPSAPEGEADYFATANCLKKLWKKHPELVSPTGKKLYLDRVGEAALASAKVLFETSVSLTAKDKTVVKKTLIDYPSEQCRIDTYLAGAKGEKRPSCWSK